MTSQLSSARTYREEKYSLMSVRKERDLWRHQPPLDGFERDANSHRMKLLAAPAIPWRVMYEMKKLDDSGRLRARIVATEVGSRASSGNAAMRPDESVTMRKPCYGRRLRK